MKVDFEFSLDASNVDEYKQARPRQNEIDDDNQRRVNPFFNLP